MTKLRLGVGVLSLLAIAATASAQSSEADETLSAVELRTGVITSRGSAGGPPSIGGALEFRPWRSLRRVSVQASSDFRHLSRREIFDEEFATRARVGRSVFLLGGALGIDLLRTSRTTIAARGGATFLRDYATFEIPPGSGALVSTPGAEWETACVFAPYNRRCDADYEVTGTATIGFRYTVRPNGGFFVGADYTRLMRGENMFLVVIGAR